MGKEAATENQPVAALSYSQTDTWLQTTPRYGMILSMNGLIAVIISLLIPPGFVYLIRKLDLHGTGKFHYNVTAILWGMIACLVAALLHSRLIEAGMSRGQIIREVAPISEEILKALVLFYLVRRADFNYVVDGAIYGFGAGIGFAMIETISYVVSTPEFAIGLALDRVFSANLIHATTSGIVGSTLAAAHFERGSKRVLFSVLGLTIAMGLHMGFNFMVTSDTSLLLAIVAGFVGIGCIAIIIKQSLNIQRHWISEMLGMTDRVTLGEAAVVQRIQNMDEVLAPIARQFGPDKASKTEALIYLQAEIGIKRKIAKQTADENKRAAIEMEIQRLAAKMNTLRREIGPYCMLFVRSVYLTRTSKLWDVLDARVGAADTAHAGSGLWSALSRRIKRPNPRRQQASNHDLVGKLKETFLFRDLPEDALEAIAQKIAVRKLSKGDVLMRKGENGDSVFMLYRGSVNIVTTDSLGRELVINNCGPGETIGEMALLDEAPRSATAIALVNSEALELKQDDFHALLNQRPDLALGMIQGLSSRLRFSTTYIEKTVEWSQKIADGDYSIVEDTPTIPTHSGTDEDKAITLLSAFFQMVKRVKAREDVLKKQVEKLTFEIDQARRKRDFKEITGTEFFTRIKAQAKHLREQRMQDND